MKTRTQYAALPYIMDAGRCRVLLITSRRSKRWIIPKGWPEADLEPYELAALEAYEEAGVKGHVREKSIGSFSYIKQSDINGHVQYNVDVFPLQVDRQYLDWPEKHERQQRWLKVKKAVLLIDEHDLAELVRKFCSKRKKDESRN